MKRRIFRKTMRRAAAVMLTLSVILSLGACKSGGSGTSKETPMQTEQMPQSGAAKDNETQPAGGKEPVEVSIAAIDIYAGMSNSGEYGEEIRSRLEEICGVKMSIDWMQDADNQIPLMLAKPESMPMVIVHWNLKGNIVSAAQNGAFVNLNDYIWDSQKYPYLSQMNENVADALSVGGRLIGIPRTRIIGRNGLSYRKDWALKVGITEDPQTVEDVYDMLWKFTYEDPDGNGKDDTYGLEMTNYTGDFDIMQSWFGVGNGWAEEEGRLVPVHMQDEYMDALNWFRKIYEDGLMPSDWAVREGTTIMEATKTGECGVFVDVMDNARKIWDYFVAEESFTPSVMNPDEPAAMQLVGPINGKTTATAGYNGFLTISATTCDTPEKIEAALTMIDRFSTNEARLLMEYGLEGIHWETDAEGNLVDLDIENSELSVGYKGLETMEPRLPDYGVLTDPTPVMTEREVKQSEVYKKNEECAVFNPATSYLLNSTTYSDVGAMLDEWITQARSQYICGEIDEAGLRAVWDKWYQNGGGQIIEEVNEQYLANK